SLKEESRFRQCRNHTIPAGNCQRQISIPLHSEPSRLLGRTKGTPRRLAVGETADKAVCATNSAVAPGGVAQAAEPAVSQVANLRGKWWKTQVLRAHLSRATPKRG